MKKTLPALLAAITLTALLACPAQAQQKFATIDLKKVFDDFYKTRIADAQIKEEAAGLDKSAKELADQEQKLIEEYKKALEDANNQAISAEEREKRKKAAETRLVEINDIQQQIKQFDRSARTNLGERQTRHREKLLKEIQTVVNARAKAGGYSFVLDIAAEGASRTPVIFYASGEDDITPAVLKELNANAPAPELPKPDKPGKP